MKTSFLILFICLAKTIWSNELPNLLNNKKDDSLYPITYYFNSAFDVSQNPYYFSQKDFFHKHKTLFKRITSPNHSIRKEGGYSKFFNDEFLTTRVIPNIGLHMIGGAYDKLHLYQYFKSKNYPSPMAFTIFLSYMGHFGNESIELSNSNITAHDHIADLYFFDAIAFYFALNPSVMNFLVNDLHMRAWHLQPMYSPKNDNITNAGLNYIFRPMLFKSNFRPFVFIGMQNLIGISYKLSGMQYLTTAFGMALTDPLEQKGNFVTAFFYDKNNYLSTSLYINGTENYRLRLNIYPEMFNFKNLKLGIMLGQKKSKEEIIGVTLNFPIGLTYFN